MATLRLTRRQILAFRRRTGSLDERMPLSEGSLRRAAWAGLQDSMPRAALLSLHARVEGVEPSTWEHPSLAQVLKVAFESIWARGIGFDEAQARRAAPFERAG